MHAMFGYGPYRDININNYKDESSNIGQGIILNPNNLPIIFCCDLNSKPNVTMKYNPNTLDKMSLDYGCECYDFVTGSRDTSTFADDDGDVKTNVNTYSNNKEDFNYNPSQGLGFVSMYKYALNGKEPEYTTWKERRIEATNEENNESRHSKHTIDYIFKRDFGNELNVTHYLEIPDIANVSNKKALLPDWHYPSDHFSLAMRFEWN